LRLICLVAYCCLVSACSGPERAVARTVPTLTPCVLGVSVTPASATLRSGDTLRLSATGGCTNEPAVWRWSSSDTLKATVDSLSGLVRANSVEGAATITATLASERTVKGAMLAQVHH
jgi:uncharacterized protein YjdB